MILRARQLSVALVGGVWFAAALLVWLSGVFSLRENARELVFDEVLPLLAPFPAQSQVVVVDIDSDSLARHGPWPWSRLVMADLLEKIARAKPAVLGLNILLSEPDRLSPAGLARNLGVAADREDIANLASKLPDGDAAVADALKTAPAVLGFVLSPAASAAPPPAVPLLARGRIEAPDIWQADGAIGPLPVIAVAGRGFGALVLAADANGAVRRVPLLVVVGGQARPGLCRRGGAGRERRGLAHPRYCSAAPAHRAGDGADRCGRVAARFAAAGEVVAGAHRPGLENPRRRDVTRAARGSHRARRQWRARGRRIAPDAGVADQPLGADPGRRGGDAARRRLAAAAVVGFGRRSLRCGAAVSGGDGNRAVPASGCGNAAHWCGLRGVGGRRHRRLLVATAVGRHGRAARARGRGVRGDRARRLRPERAARAKAAAAVRTASRARHRQAAGRRSEHAPARRREPRGDGDVHRHRGLHGVDRPVRSHRSRAIAGRLSGDRHRYRGREWRHGRQADRRWSVRAVQCAARSRRSCAPRRCLRKSDYRGDGKCTARRRSR